MGRAKPISKGDDIIRSGQVATRFLQLWKLWNFMLNAGGDSSPPTIQQASNAPSSRTPPLPKRHISWAAEPWADDDEGRPLLDDSRPRRKSRGDAVKNLFRNRLSRSRNNDYFDEESDGESKYFWVFFGAIIIVIFIAVTVSFGRPDFPHHQPIPPPYPTDLSENPAVLVEAKHGAVATENSLCSDIGVQVLKDGGNAVDAAIAGTLCIGVVNMFSSGIGGGGFMVVRIPTENGKPDHFVIDFRETAPAASNTTMFNKNPASSMWGGLSVGVPGELKGLDEAHRRWGKLPWKRLVQPSIDLANGWTVGRELAKRIQLFAALLIAEPDWSDVFAPNGRLLLEGEPIERKALARTLEIVARDGAEAFYKGPIADALLKKIHEAGGIMSQEDLDSYRVRVEEPIQGTYRGRNLYTTGPPSSGPVLLHMLNLVEQYGDFINDGRTGLNTHRIVEILKFGFAARTNISDVTSSKDQERMDHIDSKEFAEAIFPNITDDSTHTPDYYNPIYDVPLDHGTSHLVSIDSEGMVVTLTTTINLVFGSAVLDPVTGVIMNDEMDDFSKPGLPNFFGLWPSPYNYPQPDKRPLSSIAPVIMEDEDGSFLLALGGSGGSRIFGAIFQVILGLDWGLDISQAIEYPRLHNQLYPTIVDIDSGYPLFGINALSERGHNISVLSINRITSVVQGVTVRNGTIYAASDSRKNGIAAGY